MGTGSCTVEDGLDQPWGQQLLQLRSSAGGSEQKALWQPEIRGLASRSGQKLEQLCTPQWRELGVGKACISAVLHAGKSKGNPSASRLVPSSSHGSLLSPFQSVLHPHHSCQNPQGLPYCHTQCSVQRRLSRLSLSSPAVVLRLHQTVFFTWLSERIFLVFLLNPRHKRLFFSAEFLFGLLVLNIGVPHFFPLRVCPPDDLMPSPGIQCYICSPWTLSAVSPWTPGSCSQLPAQPLHPTGE